MGVSRWRIFKSKGETKLKRSKLVVRNILSSLVNRNLTFGTISFHPKQTAHTLFSFTELPGRIVILSAIGELFLIDADSLQVKSTSATTESSSSSNANSVIQASLLSSSQCSFFTAKKWCCSGRCKFRTFEDNTATNMGRRWGRLDIRQARVYYSGWSWGTINSQLSFLFRNF